MHGDRCGELLHGYWEVEKVPATEAGRLWGCPLRRRRCILYCAGFGAECMTNFRPVSQAVTSPQPPEYIRKSPLQILERANSGHAPQTSQTGWTYDVTGQVALKRGERLWKKRLHYRSSLLKRLHIFPSFHFQCWFESRLCPSIRVFMKRLSLRCVFRKCFNKLWPGL